MRNWFDETEKGKYINRWETSQFTCCWLAVLVKAIREMRSLSDFHSGEEIEVVWV
jgi:hypothetical protein